MQDQLTTVPDEGDIRAETRRLLRELMDVRLRLVEQGLDPFTPRERDYIENGGEYDEDRE